MSKKRRGNPNWTKGGQSPNPKGRPRSDAQAPAEHAAAALVQQPPPRGGVLQPPIDAHPVTSRSDVDWLRAQTLDARRDHYRNDGWYSMLTGHGTSKDKTTATSFVTDVISYQEAVERYRGDDLGARIVEAYPDEMVREGVRLCISDDADGNDEEYGKELIKRVTRAWSDLGVMEHLHTALCWRNAYGGSAIVLGALDNSIDMSEPLNLEAVRSFNWMTVVEPRELHPIAWYTDPSAPKFGKVKLWRYTPILNGTPDNGANHTTQSLVIHESRLLIFEGVRVSRHAQHGMWNGWGDSVFTRVNRVLSAFNISWQAASILVHDFAQPVFKIEDLAKIMEKDNKELFQARMQAIALSMSTARAVLIDSKEEYKREQTPVTGLPELLELFCKRLAAAAGIPVSVLFGESPGGLNASGASGDQMRIFYDRVMRRIKRELVPALEYITRILFATMGGEPASWSIEPNPLWQASEKEQADTQSTRMNTAKSAWDMGALSSEEIRRSPGFAETWGIELDERTDIDQPTPGDVAEMLAANENATPGAPSAGAAPAGEDIQKEAMNGAQVTSLIEVIRATAAGEIPRNSAQKILELAFQLSPADAAAMLPPEGFEPTSKEPAPSPFGGPPQAPPPPAGKPEGKPTAEPEA